MPFQLFKNLKQRAVNALWPQQHVVSVFLRLLAQPNGVTMTYHRKAGRLVFVPDPAANLAVECQTVALMLDRGKIAMWSPFHGDIELNPREQLSLGQAVTHWINDHGSDHKKASAIE